MTTADTPPPGDDTHSELRGIGDEGALRAMLENVRTSPTALRDSVFRHGRPTSNRARSQTVFSNFFLHILPTRTHIHSIKAATTLGLGVATAVLFGLLCVTGILLMIYYKPSVEDAYDSMLDIIYVVPTGRAMRNMHRWAAHGMVVCVILHMARAFYTAAYKGPRRFNWLIGMSLFVLTLGLSFTGYLLPWDQLAFWAITIGANIAESPRELTDAIHLTQYFDPGGMQRELLLGAHHVGEEALIRFYVLHVMVLPIATVALIAVHIWRVRKDGGLARPRAADARPESAAPQPSPTTAGAKTYGLMALVKGTSPVVNRPLRNTVLTWPNVLYVIGAVTMVTILGMLLLGIWFDAPLVERANPGVPENPAKAPWYFLGLQELVSYSAFMGGMGIPLIVLFGVAMIPYFDREQEDVGVWFSGRTGVRVTLASIAYSAVTVVGMLWFTVKYGWLRSWEATSDVPQIVITFFNPGTVIVVLFAAWSVFVVKRRRSTRMGAIALFTCWLVGFVILTYFATVHRGPNWDFYWSQADWPVR